MMSTPEYEVPVPEMWTEWSEDCQDAEWMLKEMGVTYVDKELMDAMLIARNCLKIMSLRRQEHGMAHKVRGFKGLILHMDSKLIRLMQKFWHNDKPVTPKSLDDAYDLINYTILFIQEANAGNRHGVGS